MLYTTRDSIHRLNMGNGKNLTIAVEGIENVVSIEYDYQHNCVFWADVQTHKIQVSSIIKFLSIFLYKLNNCQDEIMADVCKDCACQLGSTKQPINRTLLVFVCQL